jgi:hypothetical protein
MTYALVAYTAGAVSCGMGVAFDLLRHRDGLSRSAITVRVVAATVLWPLVVVAGFASRGRQ